MADQAAGLRRVLAPPAIRTRVITGASASSGHSAISANLAVAWAEQGRDVLLIDAANVEHGAAWLLGGDELPDLMDAVCGTRDPRELSFAPRPNLRVLRAPRFLLGWQRLKECDLGTLAQTLATICEGFDVLVIDAPAATFGGLPLADNAVVVSGTDADSIMRTYRLLKREAPSLARRQVSVLLQSADGSSKPEAVFGNLAATSRQFLGIALENPGALPDDPLARRAWSMRQPVLDLFPRSEAAHALRRCADTMMLLPERSPASLHIFVARIVSAVRALGRTR